MSSPTLFTINDKVSKIIPDIPLGQNLNKVASFSGIAYEPCTKILIEFSGLAQYSAISFTDFKLASGIEVKRRFCPESTDLMSVTLFLSFGIKEPKAIRPFISGN